ncbi:HAMP domain-containing histidine kinase [bacterium]|nr:HAMP domain-containing histidine kinase [bacterium]
MGKPKKKREFKEYWILILGVVIILLSFVAIGTIWSNVQRFEKLRHAEHENFTKNISKTADYFLSNKDYVDFSKTRKLLKEINFLDEIAVFIDGKQVLPSADEKITWPAQMDAKDQSSFLNRKTQKLYVQQNLNYHEENQARIKTIFSLAEYQAPKNGILQAFAVIGFLLLILAGLGIWLYTTHHKLKKTEKTKADMIYGITHDAKQDLFIINTKLSSLLGKLDENKKIVDLKKDLKISKESTDSIYRFVDNLNDQQKLEEGKTEIRIETMDITESVVSVMQAIEEHMAKRGMRYKYNKNTGPFYVEADPQVLKRIIKNLLHNAMKFSPFNTEIGIRIEKQEEMVRILISDQGPGIYKKDWEKIFQPYMQLNPNKEGMGLGLATSRKLAELMEGSLGVSNSVQGKGAEFFLTIPTA